MGCARPVDQKRGPKSNSGADRWVVLISLQIENTYRFNLTTRIKGFLVLFAFQQHFVKHHFKIMGEAKWLLYNIYHQILACSVMVYDI